MENTPPELSVIIITKNNAATIDACLRSVQPIANEIIIVDSGSTDNTLEIAKHYTTHISQADWRGPGIQKNRALAQAKGPWILSIDSDETLTPACAEAIKMTLQQPRYQVYAIRHTMYFAGKVLQYGNCAERLVRLFKKNVGRFSEKVLHESLCTDCDIGYISAPILHYSYPSVATWISKMNQYSDLFLVNTKRQSCSITNATFNSIYTFIKMYVFKRGFLDGKLGFVMAVNAAVSNYYKYLKLALNDQPTSSHSSFPTS